VLGSDSHETTGNSLKRTREKGGNTTRKLIGHSGPVYALSFDPTTGSAAPPRHLLSASADSTVRLWSLDTMSNLVAYRGHQNPVWDVEWSPSGIYFATASRDRTARLWSTDRPAALRIFAGHLSDVDVRMDDANDLRFPSPLSSRFSAYGFTPMPCISPRDLQIRHAGYGMCKRGTACACSLGIRAVSLRWL